MMNLFVQRTIAWLGRAGFMFMLSIALFVSPTIRSSANAESPNAQTTPAVLPAGESIESRFLSHVRQVTSELDYGKAGEGYFSPDGKWIVYQATPPGYPFYQIFMQPLGDRTGESGGGGLSKPVRLSTGRGRTTCSFFSRGKGDHVIFASSHLDPNISQTEADAIRQQEDDRKAGKRRRYSWDFDKYMDIFEATREGKIVRQLTDTIGYDAECAYSPDGTKIVFCSDRDGDADLYIMNADGTGVRQLTDVKGYDGGPFFSPDGNWVVYRSDRLKQAYLQIHVISVDGKHDVALTDNIGVNWAPYWHPTEKMIIWTGADHTKPGRPNYDLWMMPYQVDGHQFSAGEKVRITDHSAADVLPVFSPDGKQLMWTSNRTANHTSQLFIADFEMPAVSE